MEKSKLYQLFAGDDEFLTTYTTANPHILRNLDSVVDDNWNKIKDLVHFDNDYSYFSVDWKSDVIPWVVGFYVKPEYRKNNNLIEDIIKVTDGSFIVGVYSSNTRAIKFLKKECKIMKQDNTKTIFYYMRGR